MTLIGPFGTGFSLTPETIVTRLPSSLQLSWKMFDVNQTKLGEKKNKSIKKRSDPRARLIVNAFTFCLMKPRASGKLEKRFPMHSSRLDNNFSHESSPFLGRNDSLSWLTELKYFAYNNLIFITVQSLLPL